jgi:hypothetical protein
LRGRNDSTGRRLLALTLGLTALPLLGCLQEISALPERAVVTGELRVDGGGGRANVRIDIAGSAPRTNNSRDLILTDQGFTNESGAWSVATQKTQDPASPAPDLTFVVARHPEYDIAVGAVPELSINETTVVTSFHPVKSVSDGSSEPPTAPANTSPTLFRKRPGRVKFVFLRTETPFENVANVEVFGDFNGFSKTVGVFELFDDGSAFPQTDPDDNEFFSGDSFPGDGVFTRVIDGLPPGRLRYNFLINRNAAIRDLFEEEFEAMVDEDNLPVTRSVVIVK